MKLLARGNILFGKASRSNYSVIKITLYGPDLIPGSIAPTRVVGRKKLPLFNVCQASEWTFIHRSEGIGSSETRATPRTIEQEVETTSLPSFLITVIGATNIKGEIQSFVGKALAVVKSDNSLVNESHRDPSQALLSP